jgi:hypothetical protein
MGTLPYTFYNIDQVIFKIFELPLSLNFMK